MLGDEQMPGARNRQELGNAFDDAEKNLWLRARAILRNVRARG
jgi:hypothetical protein